MNPIIVITAIVAGGLGAVTRFAVSEVFAKVSRAESFGWALLVVNVVGSALGGITLGLAHHTGVSEELQLIIFTGVCGGLTTFSTFSVETVQLVSRGRVARGVVTVVANLVVALGACVLGYLLAV